MRDWRRAGLTGAVLALSWSLPLIPAAAQSEASPPAAARTAHLAVISNFSASCPELKRADPDEETVAIVIFHVGVTGLPSHASISSSSHSETLDAAATSCIMKLRFQPATSPGDGEAVASWQQLALRWLKPSAHNADPSAPTPAPAPAAAGPHAAQAADARVDVRVCVDGNGKLAQPATVVRSSGDAQFDAAALRIARSASGSYRSTASLNPATTSECVPLTLSVEQR
jgi:TonB family protein